MKKDQKRIFDLNILKGFKLFIISAFVSLVALCLPQAVCHVSAAEPVKFSTYLMIDENGEFATDADGKYIQLFDEKGNLLTGNADVIEYLRGNSGDGKKIKLGAKEIAFFLIDGKFYLDEEGENLLTDFSLVMPAIFKYGGIESGYTLQSDYGTVTISSAGEGEDSVYIARVSGTYEKLPAFTLDKDGGIKYFEKDRISDGINNLQFVYDADNFYDENLVPIESIEIVIPDPESEDNPLFTGYYITNGAKCIQFIDRDGKFAISPRDYIDMITDGATVEAKYCYGLTLNVEGEEILFLYADVDEGILYEDYQENTVFEKLSEEVINELSGDEERGFFAGFYAVNEDGEYIRFIDEEGNLINESLNFINGNMELTARFYQVLTNYRDEEGLEVYLSDGAVYIDPELLTRFDDIETSLGKTKNGDVIFFTYEDMGDAGDEDAVIGDEESQDEVTPEDETTAEEDTTTEEETTTEEDGSTEDASSEEKSEDATSTENDEKADVVNEDALPAEDTASNGDTVKEEDEKAKEEEDTKESEDSGTETTEAKDVLGASRVKRIKRIKIR